jgi:hypothetical protein
MFNLSVFRVLLPFLIPPYKEKPKATPIVSSRAAHTFRDYTGVGLSFHDHWLKPLSRLKSPRGTPSPKWNCLFQLPRIIPRDVKSQIPQKREYIVRRSTGFSRPTSTRGALAPIELYLQLSHIVYFLFLVADSPYRVHAFM